MLALVAVTTYGIAFLLAWGLGEMLLRSKKVAQLRITDAPNINTYQQRKPLIFFNIFLVCALAGTVMLLFESYTTWSTQIGWTMIVAQFVFIVLIDDAWFYAMHRLLHENKYLFKKIHAVHHRVRSPLPLDHTYVHPLEWMISGASIAIAAILIVLTLGYVSSYALAAYFAFRVFHEMDVHSGVRSYFSTLKIFSWFGSAEHHSLHHTKFRGNYASTLTIWDKLLGTKL